MAVMTTGKRGLALALLAVSALTAPSVLAAQDSVASREAALLARLDRLEQETEQLRADLAATRMAQEQANAAALAASTQANEMAARVAAAAAVPPADGFRAGATTIRLGGFVKLTAASSDYSDGEVVTNSFGRDFYLPQSLPTGGAPSSRVQDFNARQSRFWLNLASDVSGHSVSAYVEVDFETAPGAQGTQRTTNGYDLALRRGFLKVDRWTFGQDWTTFQYTGALPESTDFVGTTEGTVFVRQPLIRYSLPLNQRLTLHLAAENAESATTTLGSATMIENGDDRMPDAVARLAYVGPQSELSLAGLARQIRAENGGLSADAFGWGISAAGKLWLDAAKTTDIRFMATYGQNIGRYVGINFGPDAVYVPTGNSLSDVNVFAALVAAHIPLANNVRLNVMGSYQSLDYADSLTLAGVGSYNSRAWSGAVNIFYSPVRNVDLGIEVRHGERELVNGAQGNLDRIEFAAKYSF